MIRWKEAKAQEASVKKQQVDRTNTIDCTFRPRMNRNSERAIKEIRGQINNNYDEISVGERLYKNSEAVYMMRSRAIEEELKKERDVEESQCTFQPVLIDDNGRFSQVSSRFQIPQKKLDIQPQEERFAKSCTFTPKVQYLRKCKIILVHIK